MLLNHEIFPIDHRPSTSDNAIMSTELHQINDTDTEVILERIKGKPLDTAVHARLRAEAARVREEIRKKHGTLNIAVDLIREARQQCD